MRQFQSVCWPIAASLLLAVVTAVSAVVTAVSAQEKSVRPGVNDSFSDPDVDAYVKRFEIESREVYARRQEILAACQIKPGMAVADVGAGTGLFTRLFAEAVGRDGRVFAVDISQKFLDHIQASSREAGLQNIELIRCEPDSTQLPANSVDVAFICDTYHHFEFPLKTMASLRSALKPDGRVIVVDFRREPGQSSEWVLGHVRAGQAVFESEIVQAGFQKSRDVAELLKENYFIEFAASSTPGLAVPQFPVIAGYGGVVAIADGSHPPRPGARILFDVTTDAKPGSVNKGLERAARLLNLYGLAGLAASDVQIAIVIHGAATRTVLGDDFHKPRFGDEANPNLPLIEKLQAAGVKIHVCGQALNAQGFPRSAVTAGVDVATAALTVTLDLQTEGFVLVPVP